MIGGSLFPVPRDPVASSFLEWRGQELGALHTACVKVGRAVGNGVLTYKQAYEKVLHAAERRGYLDRFDSDTVDGCIEVSLKAGQFSQAEPANDNKRSIATPSLRCDVRLRDLADPGGLVGDLVRWITSSASFPSPELAMGAVIAFLGALMGRNVASPTDLRSNTYFVALAGSGFGKDHARAQLKRLILAAGLEYLSGPSRFMSASALRKTVMSQPSFVSFIDEFGGMMRQMNDRNASIHNQLIRNDLLELFTSASTYFEGAAYAGTPAERIFNPNVCIYGTSTPEDFWQSVSSSNASDGLLPRFLLLNVSGSKPKRVTPVRGVTDIPPELVEKCQQLAGYGSGPFARAVTGEKARSARTVPYSSEAEHHLANFQAMVEAEQEKADTATAPFLNRAVEHAIKLALVQSVSTNWQTPIITGHAMRWGTELAWLSTCTMIAEAGDRIADTARETDLKRIFGHIKAADEDGITEGQLADKCTSIDRKRRNEILMDLELAGKIEERVTPTAGRPKRRYHVK